MKNLTVCQEYTLCLLNKVKKNNGNLYEGKYPGCIALAAIFELFLSEKIALDDKQKVIIKNPIDSDVEYLNVIYADLSNEKPKTLKKWMEHYLAGYSNKPIKRIVESVIDSLDKKECLNLEIKNGFLKDKILFNTNMSDVNHIIEKLRAELLESGTMMAETVILASLMHQSGILVDYFSKHEVDQLKTRIDEIKKSDNWATTSLVKQVVDELDTVLIITVIAGIV